jgi:hypothetical protein
MIVGSSQLWKKYYCGAFLKQMPNFSLSLTVTSDINGVLFAIFNPVFLPCINFITVNKHQKSVFFNTNWKFVRFWSYTKFVRVGFSQQPNLKM